MTIIIPSSTNAERGLENQVKFSITLGIGSELEQIQLVRVAMSAVLRHLGIVDADIHNMELAVSEIVNNSLEHGYRGAVDGLVEVHLRFTGTTLQVDVMDSAPPFPESELYRLEGDPIPIEDAEENWSMRGHGLQIVRQIVDSLTLRTERNRNCMTLKKQVTLRNKER